jgi:hypothetical protein
MSMLNIESPNVKVTRSAQTMKTINEMVVSFLLHIGSLFILVTLFYWKIEKPGPTKVKKCTRQITNAQFICSMPSSSALIPMSIRTLQCLFSHSFTTYE